MPTNEYYSVNALPVGAEIIGLSIDDIDRDEVRQSLFQDWMDHGLLIFRDVPVDNAQHLALSRCFGEIELHPIPEIRYPKEPYLLQLGGDKPDKAYVYDDDRLLIGVVPWHRDTAYTVGIATGAMLRIVDRPEQGGDTLFADTALAYDALSPEWQARLADLEYKATLRLDFVKMSRGVHWSKIRWATEEEAPGSKHAVADETLQRFPSVVHPMIIDHPVSGRKCIFISPTYLDSVLGCSEQESDELLEFVVSHTLKPDFIYRHVWRENDLVLWDNRRMMHSASGYSPEHYRFGLRTTLAGSMKTGRMFDASHQEARADLVD